MNKKIQITLFLIIAAASMAWAQPANDVLYDGTCNAVTLPLDGTCIANETNSGATLDYYGGCVNSNYPSVWYTFTLSSGALDAVDITLTNVNDADPPCSGTGGMDVSFILFDGTCQSPSGIIDNCGSTGSTFSFYDLVFGTTYFLLLSTEPGGGNQICYDICSQEYFGNGTRTGPEQDCGGGIPVCSDVYVETTSYTGFWTTDEIPNGTTCLFSGENNSVWYIISPKTAGDLLFTITTTKDYDFALYDITTIGCSGISSATPIRCNYSGTPGNTGCSLAAAPKLPALSEGAMGSPTMSGIQVTAGEVFALIIDNWTGDNTGYTLDFTASNITLADVTPPTFSSVTPSCTANTITLTMSELVKCLTIVQGDFVLTNTTTSTDYTSAITNVSGTSCGSFTDELVFTHNGTLTSGAYEFSLIATPVLADNCDNPIANTQTISFNYLADITLAVTAPSPATLCGPGTADLDANGIDSDPPAHTYTLNPGGLTNTGNGQFNAVPVNATTTFTVEVTYGGCTKTASATVTVEDNVVGAIDPVDPQVCPSGTTGLTATATINGTACASCNYQWSGASTQSDAAAASSTIASAGAGTYNVVVTTPAGCTSTLTSSTVSEASGSPGTCDVYYVNSYDGATADGLTKATPTSLTDALTKAACTNSIIKVQSGVYTFTDRVVVGSYLTIEGGYPAGFTTQTSDLSDGGAGTIIRRTNAADSDDANKCSAFSIANSTVDFEFWNLRIELPGSANVAAHAASSNMSNYGFRIGTGCTGYSITRCVIDAGVGSEP